MCDILMLVQNVYCLYCENFTND